MGNSCNKSEKAQPSPNKANATEVNVAPAPQPAKANGAAAAAPAPAEAPAAAGAAAASEPEPAPVQRALTHSTSTPSMMHPSTVGGDKRMSMSSIERETSSLHPSRSGRHDEKEDEEEYAECVKLLSLKPEQRDQATIDRLYHWIIRFHFKFLEDYPDVLIRALCQVFKYEKKPADTVVFKQGDEADKMYLIIRGAVSLWVDNQEGQYPGAHARRPVIQRLQKQEATSIVEPSVAKMQVEQLHKSKNASKRATMPLKMGLGLPLAAGAAGGGKPVAHNSVVPEPAPAKPDALGKSRIRVSTNPTSPKSKTKQPFMSIDAKKEDEEILLGILRAGGVKTVFGELALISDAKRSATVRTDLQESEFLIIDKADFDRVLKAHEREAMDAKLEQMKRFPLFQGVDTVHLTKIQLYMERRKGFYGQAVIKQNSVGSTLYFLLRGEINVCVNLSPEEKEARKAKHNLSSSGSSKDYKVISKIRPGQMFGHREALSQPPIPYTHSYICGADCEFFAIHKDNLLKRLHADAIEQFLEREDQDAAIDKREVSEIISEHQQYADSLAPEHGSGHSGHDDAGSDNEDHEEKKE